MNEISDEELISPRKVILRSDIGPGVRAISMDNSILARFSEGSTKLLAHPKSSSLLRILRILADRQLQEELGLQFMISQAVHYDRRRDTPNKLRDETDAIESAVRLLEPLLVAYFSPQSINCFMEWPVARVESMLNQLPAPISTSFKGQDGQNFECRLTPLTLDTNLTAEFRENFMVDSIRVSIPLCIYDPSEIEDKVARAFGFEDFASVTANRVADVCHASSHLRFARQGDLFVADDKHFLVRKSELRKIGIVCLSPEELVKTIDPCNKIEIVELEHSNYPSEPQELW